MKSPIEVIAAHCLEAVDPSFAKRIKPGDVVVAGRNFGAGSSREQAAEALRHLGAACVVAKSFGGIFYRNALNLGLPVLVCADTDRIRDGDLLAVDPRTGVIVDETTGERLAAQPLPPFSRHDRRRRPGAASREEVCGRARGERTAPIPLTAPPA